MNVTKMSSGLRFSFLALAILAVGTTAAIIGSQQSTENRSRASFQPIQFIGITSFNASGTSISFAKPASAVEGDVLVAHVVTFSTPVITPPLGWTLIRRDNSTTTGSVSSALYSHVVGASEPETYAWQFSTSVYASGSIAAYQNVDTTAPIDAHSGQANASKSITAPSVTTTTAQDQLLFFGAVYYNNGATTVPSGMTKHSDTGYSVYARSTMSEQALTASGPTGNRVGGASHTLSNVGQLVALKPLSTGPTAIPTLVPTNTPMPTPTPGGPTLTPTPTGGPTPTPVPGSNQLFLLCIQCNLSPNGANPGNRFSGKDFTGGYVPGLFAPGVNLSSSNFTSTYFRASVMTNANLSNSNFTNADFTNADLNGTTTTGATFTGATWNNTTCPDGTNSNSNGGTCVGHL